MIRVEARESARWLLKGQGNLGIHREILGTEHKYQLDVAVGWIRQLFAECVKE